mgnify:CR=1 FL=1
MVAGDYLGLISEKLDISLEKLLAANNLTEDAVITPGQELIIPRDDPVPEPTAENTPTATSSTAAPEPRRYTVQAGDYPELIAESFGISVKELLAVNDLTADVVLKPDQVLIIPTPPPEPTAAPNDTPEPTAATVLADIQHIVVSGDNIDTIAAQYGVTWEAIAEANGITKNSILSIGQKLTIPNVTVASTATAVPEGEQSATPAATPILGEIIYTAQAGDYLQLIADKFGISIEELAAANNLTVGAELKLGQELIIPGQMPAPTAEDTPEPTAESTPEPARPTITPWPTATKSADYVYGRPVLLAPVNRSAFEGENADVLFNWMSVGILQKDHWYRVSVWSSTSQQAPEVFYSKATSWRPPLGFYKAERAPLSGRWQVQVVEIKPGSNMPVEISPPSVAYHFLWR